MIYKLSLRALFCVMKNFTVPFFASILLLVNSFDAKAQEKKIKKSNPTSLQEEEKPLLYKFEPNFLSAVAEHRDEIKRKREGIDTLDVSDRVRRKMLKDILKTTALQQPKQLVTDSKFEDADTVD